jgi:hypothetical protein
MVRHGWRRTALLIAVGAGWGGTEVDAADTPHKEVGDRTAMVGKWIQGKTVLDPHDDSDGPHTEKPALSPR